MRGAESDGSERCWAVWKTPAEASNGPTPRAPTIRTAGRYPVVVPNITASEFAAERERKLAPFEAALASAGVTETYDRMTGLQHDDPRIFAVAFEHLALPGYDDETRAAIARSFETRGAAPYWESIEALYLAARGPLEQDALAASLSRSAKTAHVAAMKRIIETTTLGPSRIFFLRPVARLDREGGRDFVLRLLDDPELGIEADRVRRRIARNA